VVWGLPHLVVVYDLEGFRVYDVDSILGDVWDVDPFWHIGQGFLDLPGHSCGIDISFGLLLIFWLFGSGVFWLRSSGVVMFLGLRLSKRDKVGRQYLDELNEWSSSRR
jgi:hypothetical protein